jgi:predicted porin
MNAFVVGLTYANGPITAGINYENIYDQGSAALTGVSQRHQYATSMGGAYRVAPGFQVYAEYMYQYRHQGNFNFATNTAGSGAGSTRDSSSNGYMLGVVMNW